MHNFFLTNLFLSDYMTLTTIIQMNGLKKAVNGQKNTVNGKSKIKKSH